MASERPGPGEGPGGAQPEPLPPAAQEPVPTTPAAPEPAWATPPPPAASTAVPAAPWAAAAPAPPQPSSPQPRDQWEQPSAPPPPTVRPAARPQWGASPPGTPYPAAPPPPGPAPQPGWDAPGQPQPGWQGGPPPAQGSGNGCLKACLVVGVLLVVLAIVAVIGLGIAGASFLGGIGIDSSGNLKDCGIVTSAQVQTVLGPGANAAPLSGLADAIGGVALDKRVLPDAENCWLGSGTSPDSSQANGEFGRIARHSGPDATSVFDQARASAQAGHYLAQDVSGAGDEAFCTGPSEAYPGTGALVRNGDGLVYVSFLTGHHPDVTPAAGDTGVPYSPRACDAAVQIALLALH